MMKLPNKKTIIGIVFLTIIVFGAVIVFSKMQGGHNHAADVYYCPMHPTYTSNKPGDCPICNMKLVKKQSAASVPGDKHVDEQLKDICIMHNCHKEHGGKPCPMMIVAKQGEKVSCPVCGTHVVGFAKKAEKKILYWTDPMIPGFKAKGPGKSPMGMDLIPVYEEQDISGTTGPSPDGYALVSISPMKQQLIGVKTGKVQLRSLSKTIRAVGTVAHDTELYQTQAEFLQAFAAFKRAQEGGVEEITEQSRKLVNTVRLRLMHMGFNDGLIEELKVSNEPDQSLLFAEVGPIWVYAQIYEYELPYVDVGTPVTIDTPSFAQETFEGLVRALDPMVDPVTRTVRIRIQVKDAKGVLKPDMYVNALMHIDLGQVVAVPREAVFNTGTRKIVFVAAGNGVFEPREVTTGVEAEGFYEIKSGTRQGEVVVTSGNFMIDSESRLRSAMEGSAGEGGHAHGQ